MYRRVSKLLKTKKPLVLKRGDFLYSVLMNPNSGYKLLPGKHNLPLS